MTTREWRSLESLRLFSDALVTLTTYSFRYNPRESNKLPSRISVKHELNHTSYSFQNDTFSKTYLRAWPWRQVLTKVLLSILFHERCSSNDLICQQRCTERFRRVVILATVKRKLLRRREGWRESEKDRGRPISVNDINFSFVWVSISLGSYSYLGKIRVEQYCNVIGPILIPRTCWGRRKLQICKLCAMSAEMRSWSDLKGASDIIWDTCILGERTLKYLFTISA